MPSTTPRLALAQPLGSDPVAELRQAIAANAAGLDVAALDLSGTTAAMPPAGIAGRYYAASDTGILWRDSGSAWVAVNPQDGPAASSTMRSLGTGPSQALPGNYGGLTKVTRQYHPWFNTTYGAFFVDPAPDEAVSLIEVITNCFRVGSIPTTYKLQTDHGSHGVLVDVPGLTAIVPAPAQAALTPTGVPLSLAPLDQVVVVATNIGTGNSVGVTIEVVTQHIT